MNGSELAMKHGVCTVASPPEKRLSLSLLMLQLCALPYGVSSQVHPWGVGFYAFVPEAYDEPFE